MVYRPPPPAPFDGPSHPPVVTGAVDASPTWWQDNAQSPDAAAGAVVDSYGGEISQFVLRQRRDYAAGIVPVHRRMLSLGPDLDVFYMNQQGREAIHYLVRPESTLPPLPTEQSVEPLGLLALSTLAVEFFDGAT